MEEKEIVLINEETITEKIYMIRGQKVMLDFELAEIYGYDTKNFNRQVKNNITKFEGDDFMFRLTDDEWENLRCKKFTSSWGGKRYLPYAFTEQGIYMLITVLRGDVAIRQSRALIRTFKRMKDYIIENQDLIGQREYLQLSMQVSDNIRKTLELRSDLNAVEDQMADVMDRLSDVVVRSELSIGIKTLELLIGCKSKLEITIFSDNLMKGMRQNIYEDFRKEYPELNIKFRRSGGVFHDRYIILDYGTENEKIFLCGSSSKDAGSRVTSILEDPDRGKYKKMVSDLLKNPLLVLQ